MQSWSALESLIPSWSCCLAGMTVHAFLCYFVLFQAGDQEVRYVGTSTRRKRLSFDFPNLAKQKKSSLKLSRCLYFSLIATGSDAGSAGSTGSIFGGSGNTGRKRQVIRVQKEPSHKKKLIVVHLWTSQWPHVGLKLFQDCVWVASAPLRVVG